MHFQRIGKAIDPESFDHKILEIDLKNHKFHPIETSDGELFGVLWCHPIGRRDKNNVNSSHQCGEDYEHCEVMFGFDEDQHRFTSINPVTIYPSLVCTNCRAHGWLEEGKYIGDRFSEIWHRITNVTRNKYLFVDQAENYYEVRAGKDVVATFAEKPDAELFAHAKDDINYITDKLASFERHYTAPYKTWVLLKGNVIHDDFAGCSFDIDLESIYWDEAVVTHINYQGSSKAIIAARNYTPQESNRIIREAIASDPWNLVFKDKSKYTFEELEARWGPAPALGEYKYYKPED